MGGKNIYMLCMNLRWVHPVIQPYRCLIKNYLNAELWAHGLAKNLIADEGH